MRPGYSGSQRRPSRDLIIDRRHIKLVLWGPDRGKSLFMSSLIVCRRGSADHI